MTQQGEFGRNLVETFGRAVRARGDGPFLWAKREGAYRPLSWRAADDQVRRLARCLADLGTAPGDRVAVVGENRPEWCLADLAVLTAGGVTVPTYTTNTPDDHAYILRHSDAVGVVVSGRGGLAKRLLPALADAPAARFVISMDGPLEGGGGVPQGVTTLDWAGALARGEGAPDPGDRASALGPDDLACFIYTSGTGGRPKGVMLSHGNILANLRGLRALIEGVGLGDEVFLSFLPLSHSYEHTAGQFLPIGLASQICYAEGVETLSTNLAEVRPTIVTCVPRLFEVLRQRITNAVEREGGLKARLFQQAIELGARRYRSGGRLPPHLALADVALERLVRAKVRERFGGRIKALVSGGAPLNPEVGTFFIALGLPLLQGYGQTESSPVVSVNPPWKNKLETTGPPLEGVEVRLAEDGEILVRGGLVMKGYWKDEEATAATLRDGWLHTGDVGVFDEDGYLKITDRKKDLIVNSGGDNIAPQRVEGVLLLEPEIGQALVYGDRRPNLVALLVPHPEFVKRFAREHGRGAADQAELASDPAFKEAIGAAVARANKRLSAIERVRRFHVMPEPFTVENGMMTPTMKLKRHLIVKAHQDVIEGLYAGPAAKAGAAA
jgi:long-chain acyl-CoA synthetase